jgi:hypothetical protein
MKGWNKVLEQESLLQVSAVQLDELTRLLSRMI